jgi:hypothetical protein
MMRKNFLSLCCCCCCPKYEKFLLFSCEFFISTIAAYKPQTTEMKLWIFHQIVLCAHLHSFILLAWHYHTKFPFSFDAREWRKRQKSSFEWNEMNIYAGINNMNARAKVEEKFSFFKWILHSNAFQWTCLRLNCSQNCISFLIFMRNFSVFSYFLSLRVFVGAFIWCLLK